MSNNQEKYPMRINRYLALKGFSTRRGADLLVEQKKVKINGHLARLGDKVFESDKIDVESTYKPSDFFYLAYHKPKGEITAANYSVEKIKSALVLAKDPVLPTSLFPVGRLDKDSSGLLLLTNDGRITDRLLNPNRVHDKEYEVEIDKPVLGFLLKKMEMGMKIENQRTKKCQAEKIGSNKFTITLTEGKKHQIRRMCAALGWQVRELKRTRIMNISLANLAPSRMRPVLGEELKIFLQSLKLS